MAALAWIPVLLLGLLLHGCDGTYERRAPASREADAAASRPVDSSLPDSPPGAAGGESAGALQWTTPFGPGGARASAPAPAASPDDEPDGLSRLHGVVFDPDGRDILFVGVREPGTPLLDPDDLRDAFVVAYRARSSDQAPGVSIDPKPGNVQGGIDDGDPMDVRYFGGCDDTVVGAQSYEADRLMKGLSLERDNVTRAPLRSQIPGFRSHLDLAFGEAPGNTSWTRFWIEQRADRVSRSVDGRAYWLDTELVVRAKPMIARGDDLVDRDAAASPSARAFAGQMTERYWELGAEFPVFRELHATAQMVALAEAVLATTGDNGPRPELDAAWLLDGYRTRVVAPTPETPAMVAERSGRSADGRVSRTIRLTGGVTLEPRNSYASNLPAKAEQLHQAVLADKRRRRRKRIVIDGRAYEVAARPLRDRTYAWQSDLTVGGVEVVRELGMTSGGPAIDQDWRLRVPSVVLAREMEDVSGLGRLPRSARVAERNGERFVLGGIAEVQLPGQPRTPALVARGSHRQLLMFPDRWEYHGGDVPFVSRNGRPIEMAIPPGVDVIEFAPGGARVQRVSSSTGSLRYEYRGDRLVAISDGDGNRVDLVYDGVLLKALRASDGRTVEYRRDADGALRAVVSGAGRVLSYRHDAAGKTVGAYFEHSQIGLVSTVPSDGFDLEPTMAWDSIRDATDRLSTNEVRFVAIEESVAGNKTNVRLAAGGMEVDAEAIARGLRQLETSGALSGDATRALRSLATEPSARRRRTVVLGNPILRERLADALRIVEPQAAVSTASSPDRALERLARRTEPGLELVHVEAGLPAAVNREIARFERADDHRGALVVVGHNSSEFQERIDAVVASGKARDRPVILLTCGTERYDLYETLLQAGASRVLGFAQPVRVEMLPRILALLAERLRGPPNGVADASIDRVFYESVETVERSVKRTGAAREAFVPRIDRVGTFQTVPRSPMA